MKYEDFYKSKNSAFLLFNNCKFIIHLHLRSRFKLNLICILQFKSQIFAPWTQRQRRDRSSRRGRAQERNITDSNDDQVQDVQVLSRVWSAISRNRQVLLRVRRQKARVVKRNIVLRESLLSHRILIF